MTVAQNAPCPSDPCVRLQYDHGGRLPGNSQEDITLYYRCNSLSNESLDFFALSEVLGMKQSADLDVILPGGKSCRGMACWCQSRNSIAVTFRGHGIDNSVSWVRAGTLPQMLAPRDEAPNTLAELIRLSGNFGNQPLKGLVVVAGETGSGKSVLADGLLRTLLNPTLTTNATQVTGHRHLIVLGKPVDWFPLVEGTHAAVAPATQRGDNSDLPSVYEHFGIQYTPRVLGVDTTLEQALVDALRQKPIAIYLDEVRKETDWPAILRFAESGHLIVTTAHAGNINDMIAWIFRSMKVDRRSQAPSVAKNILAVVHAQIRPGANGQKRQYPEIWLGARGARLLGAYGLGALIPAYDSGAAYIARDYLATHIYSGIRSPSAR